MDDKKVTVKVHEYGNVIMTSTGRTDGVITDDIRAALASLIEKHTQEIREVLDICGDAEILTPFDLVEGPNVDPLMRFKPMGFYGRFSSANYDKLQAHFACHKEHVPDDITLDFINQMIGRYAAQEHARCVCQEDDDY